MVAALIICASKILAAEQYIPNAVVQNVLPNELEITGMITGVTVPKQAKVQGQTQVAEESEEDELIVDVVEYETKINDEERQELLQLVHAEAGNQSLYGKQLVVCVVLNRMYSDRFSQDTVHEVIYAPGQFSVVKNGAFKKAASQLTDTDYEAVETMLQTRVNSEVLFFNGVQMIPGTTYVLTEGDHVFSK